MKKLLVGLLLVISSYSYAGQITLINSGLQVSGSTKYCFYSNGMYDKVIEVSASRQCPYTRTFSTESSDDE